MREKRWLLLALYGFVLANAASGALKATRPKFKIATTSTTTTSTTTEESHVGENENEDNETTTTVASETNATTGHTLTGIPQIDYIWDPNLPRELNGYNLSDYPFYNSIPEDIDFKCDGLHDGFYASVPHKCQVYHHCLFGTRYDFLCANFTAFDQKTFICHFVSEVDCANSKKYWHRNDALYKAATTSTTSTTTTTTLAPVTAAAGRSASRDRDPPPRRRRPFRRRPAYDYYDEEYYDDEYGRPRGYGRDDYEYEDRKYRRDRDRDFRDRDRDFRDRDTTRSRDGTARDDRDRDIGVRDRFPARNNRRDPPRTRDPPEEEARIRGRDSEQGSRFPTSREADEIDLEDRRTEPKIRDSDDRRYSDKRYRDYYDEKDPAPAAGATAGATAVNTEGLVKPAAPLSSVYARPRTPPKIRRPVPLSEQDRYAYKATSVQSTEEPRRRPVDVAEDDYYEDELEEVRPPRRPLRRRPSYRDRDRDFYDTRDRDRDRPFRPRYRDDEDDVRPRKHPDRSRDRYYDRERDRGRDRSLDRGKERDRGRAQDADRQERPYSSRPLDRERDPERSRPPPRSKDPTDTPDTPRRPSVYDRTSERATTTTSTSTTTTCLPEQLNHKVEADLKETVGERSERPSHQDRPSRPGQSQNIRVSIDELQPDINDKPLRTTQHLDYQDRDHEERREHRPTTLSDEYSSEYYDEPEDPPAPPPRTAVRIVKRPFLPSRGGNPNPRGLSPVGYKAMMSYRKDDEKAAERTSTQDSSKLYYTHESTQEGAKEQNQEKARPEEKQAYDAYKVVQAEGQIKHRPDDYDTTLGRPMTRRPVDRQREDETSTQQYRQSENRDNLEGVPQHKWSIDEYSNTNQNVENTGQTGSSLRKKGRVVATENPNVYSSSYKNDENQEQPTGPGNFRAKQRINEVTHRLQDIPESEYDVTLNEALTPTLNQEANLPSGFVLPLHRQLSRDAVLQPSENNYKVSRPVSQPQQQQQPSQQQQKPFVPSPPFLPTGISNNDRLRTVYYRTPDTIQISGAQYRQHRGPWHDYTGY